jgi:hypothetical protein
VSAARTRYGSRLTGVMFVPRAVVEPNRLRERWNLVRRREGESLSRFAFQRRPPFAIVPISASDIFC